MLPVLLSLFLVGTTNAQVGGYPQITEQTCDAMRSCGEGLECYSFPSIGLRCAQPNPCSYYKCPAGTQCLIAESYPGKLTCSCTGPECPISSDAETVVEYDVLTKTTIYITKSNGEPVSNNITIWKATTGNRGILETATTSVGYIGELAVENSKLVMETSAGKNPINIMPEAAIAASETPDNKSIKKIELKEESQKPIYFIEGVKRARILFVFPVSLDIKTKISAETGKVISIEKPWWSFLAW